MGWNLFRKHRTGSALPEPKPITSKAYLDALSQWKAGNKNKSPVQSTALDLSSVLNGLFGPLTDATTTEELDLKGNRAKALMALNAFYNNPELLKSLEANKQASLDYGLQGINKSTADANQGILGAMAARGLLGSSGMGQQKGLVSAADQEAKTKLAQSVAGMMQEGTGALKAQESDLLSSILQDDPGVSQAQVAQAGGNASGLVGQLANQWKGQSDQVKAEYEGGLGRALGGLMQTGANAYASQTQRAQNANDSAYDTWYAGGRKGAKPTSKSWWEV
jgi:hypothetical protein